MVMADGDTAHPSLAYSSGWISSIRPKVRCNPAAPNWSRRAKPNSPCSRSATSCPFPAPSLPDLCRRSCDPHPSCAAGVAAGAKVPQAAEAFIRYLFPTALIKAKGTPGQRRHSYRGSHPARCDKTPIAPGLRWSRDYHLYGQAADLDPILASARRHGVAVIEDCAQATGGLYRGGRLGSVGDIGCFSFYPTKNLGAIGDGGMILTHEHNIADRAQRLRQYGWDDARESHEAGLNSRLDPLQAAILHAKLPHLDADNARRASIARRYQHGLQDLPIAIPKERVGILRNILMGEAMRSVRFRSWNRGAKRSRHAGLRWRKTNWRSVSRSIIPTISTALRHPSSGTWLSATRRISSMFRRANCAYHDEDWKLHRCFFAMVGRFLKPGGITVLWKTIADNGGDVPQHDRGGRALHRLRAQLRRSAHAVYPHLLYRYRTPR